MIVPTMAVVVSACAAAEPGAIITSTVAPTATTAPAAVTAAPPTTEPATTDAPVSAPATTAAPATDPTEPLPPHERDDLAAIFDPMVEPLGYRITRASVFDRTTFEVGGEGAHLALYVEPIADISDDQFARDFPALVKIFLPLVFDRWPALDSFDLCQEPFGHQEETPPSLTLIDISREPAAGIEWQSLDLAGLIDLHQIVGIGVWANLGVRESDTWQKAAGA